jgi:hypothetical protein
MKRILVTCIAVSLGAYPCFAASPKIEAAVETFKAVSADTGKLKAFCEMAKTMDAKGDAEDPVADAKIQGYMKQLGTEFETAFNSSDEVDEGTPDGAALRAAFDDLSGKCA